MWGEWLTATPLLLYIILGMDMKTSFTSDDYYQFSYLILSLLGVIRP